MSAVNAKVLNNATPTVLTEDYIMDCVYSFDNERTECSAKILWQKRWPDSGISFIAIVSVLEMKCLYVYNCLEDELWQLCEDDKAMQWIRFEDRTIVDDVQSIVEDLEIDILSPHLK